MAANQEQEDAVDAHEETSPAQQQMRTMKSRLTMMLAEKPALSSFHAILSAVPRKAGAESEDSPLETIDIPMGTDFVLKCVMIVIKGALTFYCFAAVFSLISALANMMGGSCGQETWKVPAEEACQELIYDAFALHERRCLAGKPPQMSTEDFENVCGDLGSMIAGLVLAALYGVYIIYQDVVKIPTKVRFHKDFFTVQTWDGQSFQGSFYADVTEASSGILGLSMTTRAKLELKAGGEDENESSGFPFGSQKKGKVVRIMENKTINVNSGHGQAQQQFLGKVAQYVPVKITGFQGQAATVTSVNQSATLIEGRVKTILDARKADASSYTAIRMPVTADLATTFLFIFFMVVGAWYFFTRITTLIDWSVAKGAGKCSDPLRPGVDLCAVERIFYPINVPIQNPSDWINLVLALLFPVLGPVYFICMMETEYRFHKDGDEPIQEVLLARWEWQPNKFFFPDDIEGIEKVDGSMEKCLKLDMRTVYTIEGGITEPYKLTASFAPKSVKMGLLDPTCASCSGHGQAAKEHTEKLTEAVKEAKPGMLLPGVGDEESAAEAN